MDIFNKKRVAKLEEDLAKAQKELYREQKLRESYRDELANLKEIAEFEKHAMPEDCRKGPWCASCEFAKGYYRYEYDCWGRGRSVWDYACGKGESCKNFIQKEVNDGQP